MGDTGPVVVLDGRPNGPGRNMKALTEFTSTERPCCQEDAMPDATRSGPSQAPMPVDLLESCRGRLGSAPSDGADPEPAALTVDSLRKVGVELVSDIRLIDDTDETTECIEEDSEAEMLSPVDSVALPRSDAQAKERKPAVDVSEDVGPPKKRTPLKSALKKGAGRRNKGLKVSFHDTHVFFIDTDAEVSAEPQLLTVRTFDLPLVLSDIRVFTPTFDFVPSLPPGSYGAHHRQYTYEDAIVSFDDCDDVLVCRNVAPLPSAVAASSSRSDADIPKDLLGGHSSADGLLDAVSGDTDCPLLTALQQESIAESQADGSLTTAPPPEGAEPCSGGSSSSLECSGVLEVDHTVRSLTEANLKQHEILMANDILVSDEEQSRKTTTNVTQVAPCVPVPVVAAVPVSIPPLVSVRAAAVATGCSLSPPLKELTVDIRTAPGGEGSSSDDWQVELSPLNSIPESETESSNSSQDTIIMMTTEESRRNEEHIQRSTELYRRARRDEDDGGHSDTASQCSQDSDETLKQVDDVVPPPVQRRTPPTTPHQAAMHRPNEGHSQRRTSDQIRQVLERNAVRRNVLRYSNIRRKQVDGVPMDKQRQWRSHESLLDTIKKLTDDEVDDDDDDSGRANGLEQHSWPTNGTERQNQGEAESLSLLWDSSTGPPPPQQQRPGKISAELANRIALPRGIQCRSGPTSSSSGPPNVPRDVRQWKIRSNQWNSLDSIVASRNGEDPPRATANGFADAACTNGHSGSGSESLPSGGSDDDLSDELLMFVHQDSERIERIRKRYSYTDGDDYESVGSFARRPSVRGIKPRFGSTTEILKQLQSQLQPPPLAHPSSNHMTWPYPRTSADPSASSGHPTPNGGRYHPLSSARSLASLPVVEEEIYGTSQTATTRPLAPQQLVTAAAASRMASYGSHNEYQPVYRTRRGREGGNNYAHVSSTGPGVHQGPPPYQPPPPLPPPYQPPPPLMRVKDERGAPEGASSSPKVVFDSTYRNHYQRDPRHHRPGQAGDSDSPPNASSSCVYYVMQV